MLKQHEMTQVSWTVKLPTLFLLNVLPDLIPVTHWFIDFGSTLMSQLKEILDRTV